MSLDAIAGRLSRALAGHRVWLGPRLEALHAPAGDTGPLLAVVAAQQLSLRGEVRCHPAPSGAGPPPPEASEVIAVLLLDGEPRGTIVERIAGPVTAQVRRIFCEEALLEVRPEGLAIVELAPGVSARDFQSRIAPTLLIAPELQEMVVTPARVDV